MSGADSVDFPPLTPLSGQHEGLAPAGLTSAMEAWTERGYPGFDVRVSRGGKLVYANQVGWRDREAGVPLGEDSIFRIYSMTKPVICTALMVLHEEGKFLLTDLVSDYVPGFSAARVLTGGRLETPDRPMQVRDLMTMT